MRNRFASLTSRLVVTTVVLVAVLSVLIGTATSLAMRNYLMDQLDSDIVSSAKAITSDHDDGPPGAGGRFTGRNQGPGTLNAFLGTDQHGEVLGSRPGDRRALSSAALEVLDDVPADGRVHAVTLPAFGSYRVTALEATMLSPSGTADGVLVIGMPSSDVDDTVASLIWWEALLGLLGVLVAAGAASYVVRRQLRPLHEVADTAHAVAALPLASGEIDLAERVPEHLTDERTEVGQVGAALNTLLAHVESSLSARHRSEQQVRQFVADASHELRSPLATIAGYTELARRRPDDAGTVRTALDKVEEESGRMTSLVEDLLLLARLDSGRPLERRPVDLTLLLLEAVSDARVVAPDHRWQLELPDDAVEVEGDEQRLHQVVTNLLTNARKYTPAGTTVTVRATASGFAVHDDGPGFPPELADHAFERFARGDTSRTRGADGGAGLGLSLVEAIVSAHGGTVTLASEPGDTTLTVTLPS
ncbi:HAMP domain-containing histidine kinase [Nocardioides sp. KIGAM211]|uniref:histidine kinase n=1 Tax=Nocardioides luti TaxID=2761101 RepID=A0A7X0RF72_9ACTN|nr:HAMP domain-containing sensor histidine kinase [Nocardioides luti]MBB6627107.1 HAMP domain-containing histidine kinase [Nocardioides luti]